MALNTKRNYTNNNSINLSPAWTYRHPQMVMDYNSFLTCERGQIFEMGCLNVPLGFLIVTTRVAVCTWVDISNECCGPVEWSRVVLPQEHRISRLDVMEWAMPALAMLQLMEIVSRPFPVVLGLLLECLPPGQSTHFDVWVVSGG